ncbi:ABC transporter permease [Marinomonas mediterranea]|jgi:mannose ABC transporter membrane protein/fructose ABC transporter membrane protein/ribose ABC transporter membrane protein|uniref:ABC-type transporter, integral membrane subunit n=1 Tax=Marinomonas mediterranea (strain ATCC 700492 / JCM 21426 / NBRC 103028 / MMB-1) TaxID=717774 RepID=F2JZ98_MARM1|nr:ABC transporter permease [Marinomonas mediterranea]ADZ93183.1 ABC-type transporter, integral membrane subunit [Marinomonas mediterranea MMB-1]WCN11081.1 ABC transporter permease [Marinomonas mediterranea]WCN15141.1 ABC transporter permease [Marinomonas mediterranea]WCN19184.1 ABC transporter permease [Marinomonas mediterranea MMB-1]
MSSTNSQSANDKVAEHDKVADQAGAYVAKFESKGSLVHRFQKFLHQYPVAAPLIVLLLAIFGFSLIVGDRFLHPFNLSLVLQQVTIIGVIGIAQTLIILTAGIDLSVGAIMVLSSVVMGRMAIDYGIDPSLALLIGIATGAITGFINGTLITRLKLPPFIATLGSWNVFFALNLWYSKSQTIRSQEIAANAPLLQWLGETINVFGARLTYGSILMLLLFVVIWYALNWTAWGRHVYATGDDPAAAKLAGIRTDRVLLSVYILAGVICAIGAWVLIGRIGSVSPQAGYTTNLDSITAVVIGGCSLFGGRGSIFGTLVGALIVGVFRNGLALAGVDVLWQEFTVGILIIVAVGADQWIRKGTA